MGEMLRLRTICKIHDIKKLNEINIKSNCSLGLMNCMFELLFKRYRDQEFC